MLICIMWYEVRSNITNTLLLKYIKLSGNMLTTRDISCIEYQSR